MFCASVCLSLFVWGWPNILRRKLDRWWFGQVSCRHFTLSISHMEDLTSGCVLDNRSLVTENMGQNWKNGYYDYQISFFISILYLYSRITHRWVTRAPTHPHATTMTRATVTRMTIQTMFQTMFQAMIQAIFQTIFQTVSQGSTLSRWIWHPPLCLHSFSRPSL